MQQIVACKASTADPKARYYVLLPEGGEEAHSFRHCLPDTSSETGQSVMTTIPTGLQCRTAGASVHTRGA
jgi:hypothetical protein